MRVVLDTNVIVSGLNLPPSKHRGSPEPLQK